MSDDIITVATTLGRLAGMAGEKPTDKAIAALVRLSGNEDSVAAGIESGYTLGLARAAADRTAPKNELPWPDLEELGPGDAPPPFDPVLLPPRLSRWVMDSAAQANVPAEMVAIPALVGLSSIVGRYRLVRPDTGSRWSTPPNLWGAVCSDPGTMKSHAVGAGLAPVRRLAVEAMARHEEMAVKVEARLLAAECRLGGLKRKPTTTEDELEAALSEVRSLRGASAERRYTTSDPTVEKLAELFRQNPRGLLLTRDELGAWILAMQKPGREGDREFYLESWNGDSSFTVDRIGRGTIHVPALCLSVIGGIQPARIKDLVDACVAAGGDDGFLQRLQLLVWPATFPAYVHRTEAPDTESLRVATEIYRRIDAECSSRVDEPVVFSQPAQRLYDRWRTQLEERLRSRELLDHPALCSHVAKYRGLVPSIALLLWLADREPWDGETIHDAAVKTAIAWADYLESHARRVYSGGCASRFVPASARALARLILEGAVEHGSTVREIHRSRYAGLASPALVQEAIGSLLEHGWVRIVTVRTQGRPARTLEIHPLKRRSLR